MTYVASPSFSASPASRANNLQQCLETARRRLDEVSDKSDAEKNDDLIASAIAAGWEEIEVRSALSRKDSHQGDEPTPASHPQPSASIVPSSSM